MNVSKAPSENILKLRAIVKSWDKSEDEIILIDTSSKKAICELQDIMSEGKPNKLSDFERLYNKIKNTLNRVKII